MVLCSLELPSKVGGKEVDYTKRVECNFPTTSHLASTHRPKKRNLMKTHLTELSYWQDLETTRDPGYKSTAKNFQESFWWDLSVRKGAMKRRKKQRKKNWERGERVRVPWYHNKYLIYAIIVNIFYKYDIMICITSILIWSLIPRGKGKG